MKSNNESSLMKQGPAAISETRNFNREIMDIENNQALSVIDKYKSKKQLMRSVYSAKQEEINHRLDSYRNYLLAKKDVEAKAITLEAQKAIMALEKEQVQMMKDLGLDHSDEVSSTLIKAGEMLTSKLVEVQESKMTDAIKERTIDNIQKVWDRTNDRIMESLDTYMDELYEKENSK